MKPAWKRHVVGLVVGLSSIFAVCWHQLPALVARRRMQDYEWRRTASPADLRSTAHASVGAWLGTPHDEFLVLEQYGDETSIPYLLAAIDRLRARGVEVCPSEHARDALRAVRSRLRQKSPQAVPDPPRAP